MTPPLEVGDWVMFVGGWLRRVEVPDDGLGRIVTRPHADGDREWWQANLVVEVRKPGAKI